MEENIISNESELIKEFSLHSFKKLFDTLKNLVQHKQKKTDFKLNMVGIIKL